MKINKRKPQNYPPKPKSDKTHQTLTTKYETRKTTCFTARSSPESRFMPM
jgi:hypothetical protein